MRDKIDALEQRVKSLERTKPDPLLIEDAKSAVRKVERACGEVIIRLNKIANYEPEKLKTEYVNPKSPCCGAETTIVEGHCVCKKCYGPAPL